MYFGGTTFAEDSFSAQGSKNATVAVTGVALSTAIGTETISAGATVPVTGIALTTALGTETVVGNAVVSPTGIADSNGQKT